VWRNLLLRLGFSKQQINDFIAGPAFLAWWEMNNLEGWGGPNPDSWYKQQEDLQKKILKRMKEWGMHPVLPGYSGMIPCLLSICASPGYYNALLYVTVLFLLQPYL
jgi:alpha-N-acetylglucosaminidase